MKNKYAVSLMTGIDIPIPECKLILHQPTIKEIAYITEETFYQAVQCLLVNKNSIQQDESLLTDINNFQIFMMIINDKEVHKKDDVLSLLLLLFPNYKINFTPHSLIFAIEGQQEISVVDENNFEQLQEVIKQVFCMGSDLMGQNTFNPADKKAKEIAEKLARGRQRVAAQKGETQGSMFSQYLSILTVGLSSMSLEDCQNLTMYQLLDLVERYSLYVNWDIDIRARLAGAKPDEQPDNWMKNIH